jgi:hypothetical protein
LRLQIRTPDFWILILNLDDLINHDTWCLNKLIMKIIREKCNTGCYMSHDHKFEYSLLHPSRSFTSGRMVQTPTCTRIYTVLHNFASRSPMLQNEVSITEVEPRWFSWRKTVEHALVLSQNYQVKYREASFMYFESMILLGRA